MQSFGRKPKNNLEFLDAIFLGDFSGVWVGDYTRMGGGFATPAYVAGLNPDVSNYFAAATLKEGASSRTNTNFLAGRVIVLDDVGTKIGLDFCLDFALPPTYRIETSPGNEQWGYVLEGDGETDAARWHAFIELWKASPVWKSSSDGTGLAPYKRLPFGKAHKDTCRGFETRLVDWNPGARYTLDELASMMFLSSALDDPDVLAGIKKPSMHAGLKKIDDPEVLAKDPIYRLFQHLGRVQSHAKDDGWIDVRCLWEDEHTGGAHGAAGGCAWHPKGLYRCHHSHCADRNAGTVNNLLFNYDEQDDPDAKRIFREMVFPKLPEKEEDDALLIKVMETHETVAEMSLLSQLRNARHNYKSYDEGLSLGFRGIVVPDDHPVTPRPPGVLRGLRRGQVTLLAASPGAGKSVLSIQMALAVAHEKPEVVGQKYIDWAGDTVLVSNEESVDEVFRRIEATEKFFGLDARGRKHKIHVVPGPGITLLEKTGGKNGGIKPKCAALLRYLVGVRTVSDTSLLVLDTLSSLMSGIEENDNQDMQRVMDFATHLARASFSAVVLVHHLSKGGANQEQASMFAARGASSIMGAVRSGLQLSPPSEDDTEVFGWNEAQAKSIVRLDSTKSSHSAKASGAIGFFEWTSLDVETSDERFPGKTFPVSVGVLNPISPVPLAMDLPRLRDSLAKIQEFVHNKRSDEHIKISSRSNLPGKTVGEILGVTDRQAEPVIAELEKMKRVRRAEVRNPASRNLVKVLEIVAEEVEDAGDLF